MQYVALSIASYSSTTEAEHILVSWIHVGNWLSVPVGCYPAHGTKVSHHRCDRSSAPGINPSKRFAKHRHEDTITKLEARIEDSTPSPPSKVGLDVKMYEMLKGDASAQGESTYITHGTEVKI